MDIGKVIKAFTEYTANYTYLGEKANLKIRHTIRVAELSRVIATKLGLSYDEANLAFVIGMLHDIGRFEQLKRYNTFVDKDSIDHANLGVDILKNDDFIRKFYTDSKYDNIVFKSIKNHNKYQIEDMSEKEEIFAKIIRDADKIDILYLYTTGEIKLNTNNEAFSDDVYNSLMENKSINRNKKKTKADSLAISLGFVFDINYNEALKILEEKNYIKKEIEIYKKSKNIEFVEQLNDIDDTINNYIRERLEYVRKKI